MSGTSTLPLEMRLLNFLKASSPPLASKYFRSMLSMACVSESFASGDDLVVAGEGAGGGGGPISTVLFFEVSGLDFGGLEASISILEVLNALPKSVCPRTLTTAA